MEDIQNLHWKMAHSICPSSPNQLKFVFYQTYTTTLKNENACHEENTNVEAFLWSKDGISPLEKEEVKLFYKRFKLEQASRGAQSTNTKSGKGSGTVTGETHSVRTSE